MKEKGENNCPNCGNTMLADICKACGQRIPGDVGKEWCAYPDLPSGMAAMTESPAVANCEPVKGFELPKTIRVESNSLFDEKGMFLAKTGDKFAFDDLDIPLAAELARRWNSHSALVEIAKRVPLVVPHYSALHGEAKALLASLDAIL